MSSFTIDEIKKGFATEDDFLEWRDRMMKRREFLIKRIERIRRGRAMRNEPPLKRLPNFAGIEKQLAEDTSSNRITEVIWRRLNGN